MTVIQHLVAASAALLEVAPANRPAEPSAALVAAYRRFKYWQHRCYHIPAGEAAGYAADDTLDLQAGLLSRFEWEATRGTAEWWAGRPARIKAAELAAGKAAPIL